MVEVYPAQTLWGNFRAKREGRIAPLRRGRSASRIEGSAYSAAALHVFFEAKFVRGILEMMEKTESFKIEGLNGGKTLSGNIKVSGSKNEALPLLASSLLFGDTLAFSNIPLITDIDSLLELLSGVGAMTTHAGKDVTIDGKNVTGHAFDSSLAKKFRASIIATGPLLARTGKAIFPTPGGCVIGKRPIDIFLSGYKKMGAEITENADLFTITAPKEGLHGAHIVFRIQSVTGTEALLMAAVLAHGETVLENVALEPEVTELAHFLVACGARINGIGTTTLTISGTGGELLLFGKRPAHPVMPDRIEAGSFLVLGALCAHNLVIEGCEPKHLALPLEMLSEAGVPFLTDGDRITISGNTEPNKKFKALAIRTHEYPGFPTDLQAPFSIFCTQVTGESVVEEMIFEGRLGYLEDIGRMGAHIVHSDPHKAIITGPSKLSGRELYSPDLRAGLAYIIAALVAKGTSHIHNIHYVDRGYEHLEEKLRGIGVAMERIVL